MAMTNAKAATLRLSDVTDLPVVLDVQGAARLLGISPDAVYDLVAKDEFPSIVVRAGRTIRIPTAPLLAALGVTAEVAGEEQLTT
jgi:excisionase family DNA binding protein